MKKLLFITYGGGHANIVKELYSKAHLEFNVEIIALTTAVKIFEREHIPCTKISHYLGLFKNKHEIELLGRELAQKHYNQESGLEFEDVAAYLGLSFWDLMKSTGDDKDASIKLFEKEGRAVFNPVNVMAVILKKVRPDLLVVTCSVRMEKAAAIAANQLDIPVVKINDLPQSEEIPYDCTVCVMNQFAKDYLISNRLISPSKISVTGQPVFEANNYISASELEEIKEKISYRNYKRLILYLEQYDCEDTVITEKELVSIAKENPETLYIFKLHPNQDVNRPRALSSNTLVTRDINIRALIHLCDLAITWYSTSGLEAALVGKPLIVVMLHDVEKDLSKCNVAAKIQDISQLKQCIEACLDQEYPLAKKLKEGRQKFINPPNSVENILEVIKKQLSY